jgi:hypothetical protein
MTEKPIASGTASGSSRGNSSYLEEYDEQLVRRLIEKITVYDDKLTIEFKSGVEVDV